MKAGYAGPGRAKNGRPSWHETIGEKMMGKPWETWAETAEHGGTFLVFVQAMPN